VKFFVRQIALEMTSPSWLFHKLHSNFVWVVLLLTPTDSFTLPIARPRPPGAAQLYARSVCTFDATDFSGAPGDASSLDTSSANFNRIDTSDDSRFYQVPRFVNHIDENAIDALKNFYLEEFQDSYVDRPLDILDLCSSWTSHFPDSQSFEYGRVVGLGMNQEELDANKVLTETIVQDLNKNPDLKDALPQDGSFDIVTMAVSVDYLIEPITVFQEIHRLLRPTTGKALISFSNRCFPTKAIAYWLQADDIDRLTLVASYFHYSSQGWSTLEALDLKDAPKEMPSRPSVKDLFANPAAGMAWMKTAAAMQERNNSDPMFVVKGIRA
jgi:SAM-dependent methyltransferase